MGELLEYGIDGRMTKVMQIGGVNGDENKKRRENADRKAADIEVKIYAGRAVHGNRGCADYGKLLYESGDRWKTAHQGVLCDLRDRGDFICTVGTFVEDYD